MKSYKLFLTKEGSVTFKNSNGQVVLCLNNDCPEAILPEKIINTIRRNINQFQMMELIGFVELTDEVIPTDEVIKIRSGIILAEANGTVTLPQLKETPIERPEKNISPSTIESIGQEKIIIKERVKR